MKVGVVIYYEGSMVKFRIYENVRVERGQLLKVSDKDIKYILRVADFKPEALFSQAEIAHLSLKRERGEDVDIYDKPLRYYDTAIAVVIAQINENQKLHGPTSMPSLFSDVETLGKEDLKQLNLDVGDVEIGVVRTSHREARQKIKLLGKESFCHHILVTSVTGGGKTNFGKVLAWSMMKMPGPKYSLIIIDAEGEYFDGGDPEHKGLVHGAKDYHRLLYITERVKKPSRVDINFNFNGKPFNRSVYAYPPEVWWSHLHPQDFCETGEFTEPQEALLWLTWQKAGRQWINYLLERDINELYLDLGRRIQKVTIAVTKRKLSRIIGDKSLFKDGECQTDMIKAVLEAVKMGYVILIDVPSASEEQEKLLTVILARRIFHAYRRMKKMMPEEWVKLPTVLIMVEEAHRYLSKESLYQGGWRKENIFTTISKRGRKYHVGLCCITQMPGELDETIIRQQLTKIILPLPTKPDYNKVIQYSPYLDEASLEIKTLDKGEALIVSPPSSVKFAIPVSIHKFEDLIEQELEEEIKTQQKESKEGVLREAIVAR